MNHLMTEATDNKDDLMRNSIIGAAQHLFQQYGLAKTTMEDIAREIGKGKSSLYYYYPNKEEIFIAVVQKEKKDVTMEVQQAVAKATTGREKLKSFAMARFRALRKKKVLYKILANEMHHNICITKQLRESYNQAELEIIRGILIFGVQAGDFNIPETDLDVVSYVINSALRGLEFDAMMSMENKFDNSSAVVEKAVLMLINALN